VSDYYDRLQQQLMQATARPSPRARRASLALWRPRGDVLAAASALAVLLVVVAVFISLRPSASQVKPHPAQPGLAVVHNYGHTAMPALGHVQCETKLLPPRDARPFTANDLRFCLIHDQRHPRTSGTVSIAVKPGSEVFSIDASGLPRSRGDGDYAVWFLSGTTNVAGHASLLPGRRPAFVGIVTPPVGANGWLRAQGPIPTLSPQQATGHYLFVVTRQTRPSNRSLGRIVLEGWLSF